MAHDAALNAQPDAMWLYVMLTARQIRNDTLRTLAEAWSDQPSRVVDALDQLVAGLNRPGESWDAAVYDLEADLQLADAEMTLSAAQARQLAAELLAAADRTSESRRESDRPLMFPAQPDRRAA